MNPTVIKRKPAPVTRPPFGGMLPRDFFSRTLFDDLLGHFLAERGEDMSSMMNVSMDVAETGQAFEIKVDLPGFDPEQVDIHLDNNTLTIRGERTQQSEEKDEPRQFHRMERYSGSFARSVVLPASINEEETAAEFKDGVLTIVIPKTEDAKPRRISISK